MQPLKLTPPLAYADLAARCFHGEILLIQQCEAFAALRQYLVATIVHALGDDAPSTAHLRQSAERLTPILSQLAKDLPNDPQMKSWWREIFIELGWDLSQFAWDYMPLRIVPPAGFRADWPRHRVTPHRDTWGSNIPCQINWWASLFPLSADSTIGFWPDYFAQAVANDTDNWTFARAKAAEQRKDSSVASAPQPLNPPASSALVPLLPCTDELVCFSSQHLHSSIYQQPSQFRFSIELRTIHIDSAKRGIGAKNVDNAKTNPQLGWFKRMSDNAKLA